MVAAETPAETVSRILKRPNDYESISDFLLNLTERLYREIRSLRIYEGATEVQKLIIGRELMKEAAR